MKVEDLHKPAIPIAYGHLILSVAESLGVTPARMLEGQNISATLLATTDGRLSMLQANKLLYRGLRLSGNPAFGYEIGLHSSLTTHGFVGYGLLSYPTLRAAAEFGGKFLPLRLPNLNIRVFAEGAHGVIEVHETLMLGAVRQCMFDLFLVGLWRMVPLLGAQQAAKREEVELWFDGAEPDYAERYRERLPVLRFATGVNQLRFPLRYLDLPLNTADPLTARMVTQQCEQEFTQLGYSGDLVAQLRALLTASGKGYPDLASVASRLNLSERTLKRRLHERGLGFQQLLDEARRRDAVQLLGDASLSIEQIALRTGYTDPANFTRAFRKWMGTTPSEYRLAARATA
ncbi:MAG: AraC family transcriptional regulator [Pseudomonadota bacterium]|nr:AraC family transcriptional regulator [Pseudomonadota bacterium]